MQMPFTKYLRKTMRKKMKTAASVFERHNVMLNFFRVLIVLFLDVLPAKWCKKIFLLGSNGKETRAKTCVSAAKSFKALEAIYTFNGSKAKGMDRFWGSFLSNSGAIRNRLLLTKREIDKAVQKISEKKDKVFILSLASGSARAVIETIAELEEVHRNRIFVRFVDISQEVLDYSRKLTQTHGLNGNLEWYRCSVFDADKFCKGFKPDIVEMVGMLDYLNDSQAIKLISLIRRNLTLGGRLITCNIVPNIEQPFITKGLNWPMIYRTSEQLKELMFRAGFASDDVKIFLEPLGIHALCVANNQGH